MFNVLGWFLFSRDRQGIPGTRQNRTTPGIILSRAGNRDQNENVSVSLLVWVGKA